jgi:phage terminase large subunit
VVVAGEIDMDWHASTHGAIIQSSDVQASIDLHLKLAQREGENFTVAGKRIGALDVADEGKDKNAFAVRYGQLLEHVESWSGKGADLYATTQRSFRLCDEHDLTEMLYDADGLGAGIRGDARVVNSQRTAIDPETGRPKGFAIRVTEYRGSSTVESPTRKVERTNRTNQDLYLNRKAQAVFHLAMRFRESGNAARGEPFNPERIICLSSKIPELSRLIAELGQYTSRETASGKLMVDKVGDEPGAKSPNLGDAIVICFAPRKGPMNISDATIAAMGG